MPLYEYRCRKCGHIEELLVSFREAEESKFACEECGGRMERIFSVTADTHSGSGSQTPSQSASCGSGG